jgi:hypothetical protein
MSARASADQLGEERDDLVEGEVADAREQAEEKRGKDDDAGGLDKLRTRGPCAFFQFIDHFDDEDAGAAKRILHVESLWEENLKA